MALNISSLRLLSVYTPNPYSLSTPRPICLVLYLMSNHLKVDLFGTDLQWFHLHQPAAHSLHPREWTHHPPFTKVKVPGVT